MKNPTLGLPIDRAGVPYVAGGLATAAAGLAMGGRLGRRLALLGATAAAGAAFFFRDMDRDVLPVEGGVLAPADGKVIDVRETTEGEFLSGPAWKVSIFLSLFDCHVVRAPTTGVIDYKGESRGGYAPAYDPAAEANRRLSVGIRGENGHPDCLARLVAGLVARQVIVRAEIGARVSQGDRLGIICFGSRVDLFFPRELEVTITPGERTTAGITMLARRSGGAGREAASESEPVGVGA